MKTDILYKQNYPLTIHVIGSSALLLLKGHTKNFLSQTNPHLLSMKKDSLRTSKITLDLFSQSPFLLSVIYTQT